MRAIYLLVLAAALCLPACGGSGSNDDDDDDPNTFQLNSIASLDGEVKAVGTVNETGTEMNVGLLQTGAQCRAFVTFDISQFNVNDNVVAAGVSLPFISQTGSPFTVLGDLIVEDVDIAGSLTPGDYDLLPLSGATTLNRFSHVADVGVMVQTAISAGQNRLSFRFRFASLVAPPGTFITYGTRENAGPPPFLAVTLGEPNP